MKTFHLVETVYREYFIEADSVEDAIDMIETGELKPYSENGHEEIEVVDVHDGKEWRSEKVA